MLTDAEIESFVADGFVRVPGAVPGPTVRSCREQLWEASGFRATEPEGWTEPVVRIAAMSTAAFREAGNTPPLREAYDQLVGAGRWRAPLGMGTFPIRFPGEKDPGDDGWHLDAGWSAPTGEYRVNLRSRGRALLMLFLLSDVGPDDAPTRIRVGSHLDLPPLLAAAGEEGREWFPLCADAVPASADRPQVAATGRAGDVFLCHPFLVHAAQRHRGSTPRFLAQPPLEPVDPVGAFDLDRPAPAPVERAVLAGLRGR
ncbi:phytanoyl-CoA dioxygenase family protein [Streptomyces sp. NPDC059917]|uniref:phytanoyl-CoA dioxygenase family protein n=1 Tax=Streptomyces sp. NPDC059917 TaxID=3347002 RepID=UPI00364A654B